MSLSIRLSRRWIAGMALLLTLLLGCGKDNPFAPEVRQDNEVWIQANGFEPQVLTVDSGTTVVWINKDTEVHTVESGTPLNYAGLFSSKNIKPGQQWSYTFTKPGTYDYYCSLHERTGKIVVQ